MQTILGANGTIARELSKHLPQYTNKIRQVSRNPKQVNSSDELVKADLLDYARNQEASWCSLIMCMLTAR
jgi:putative NADH-flavin reductase